MPATEEDLLARLGELGIETTTHRHPPLNTVEESKELRGDLPGGHSKNLFLKDKKGVFWLIVAEEDRPVDLKTLHKRIGSARLSFGKPDPLMDLLGVRPGSVTPFGLINDTDCAVNVVLDKEFLANDRLHFHPLHNEATTAIAAADLIRFIEATGHDVQKIDLSVSE